MAFGDHSLGKSLSDVFARTQRKDAGGKGYLEVDISAIVSPADNPRKHFAPSALQELAASIAVHGILQPLVVRKKDAGYEIISGERRYRAAKAAGLAKVPVVIREDDSAQRVAELRLIENIQRENLNPIELARAFQALIDHHGLTHEVVAERVSKDRSSITNNLRLLTLPDVIQAEIAEGAISMGHAKALLAVTDRAYLLVLARRIIEEKLSVRDVERLSKAGPETTEMAPATHAAVEKHAQLRELETNLYHLFGARVAITERKGRGSLTVHFDSKDHFQRVLKVLERVLKQADSAS
jgi:ParB family transcriptional regulator, chromosome partitioning protein